MRVGWCGWAGIRKFRSRVLLRMRGWHCWGSPSSCRYARRDRWANPWHSEDIWLGSGAWEHKGVRPAGQMAQWPEDGRYPRRTLPSDDPRKDRALASDAQE